MRNQVFAIVSMLALLPVGTLGRNILARPRTCTIRQTPQDCFEWWDTGMPNDHGVAISFTEETIPGKSPDAPWAETWDSVSPCQNTSADAMPRSAYIFPDLACAGKNMETFDTAVFVSISFSVEVIADILLYFREKGCPVGHVSQTFQLPLRKDVKILDDTPCLDPVNARYKRSVKRKRWRSVMLVKSRPSS